MSEEIPPRHQPPKRSHPWRRFWARHFDYLLTFTPLIILLDTGTPLWREFMWINVLWVWFLATLVWIPIEALCLSRFGTTPGKSLLKMRVTHITSFAQALDRSARLWVFGMGCGIPLLSQIRQILSYRRLTSAHTTAWGHPTKTTVHYQNITLPRTIVFIALLLVLDLLGYNLSGWFAMTFLFMPETTLQYPT